jgi:uncharacterized protein (TIGR02172 family)
MNEILLDKPMARGRTADVYPWDDGHVLKLFHNWFELEGVEYELKIAQAVHASGVKAPAVERLIQFQGRNGLIYERLAGISMLELFPRKPWMVFKYSRLLAHLHAQMHERVFNADDIPAQHERLQNKINHADALPSSLKTSLLNVLHSLPAGDRVCHGDFHPGNVLITSEDATVIDWIDTSRGNPLADVARTTILLMGAAETDQIASPFLRAFIKLAHATYLHEYFRLRPYGRDQYRLWLPIVAGARLSENIAELEEWLVKEAEKVK